MKNAFILCTEQGREEPGVWDMAIMKGVFGMAKKGLGKFVAFAAIAGAAAAGVSYVLQYKTFHKELEKDFREFEEDEEEDSQENEEDHSFDPRKLNRNYISLASSRDEFKVAAKDIAQATKNVLKDAGTLFSDTAHEAVSAAVDTAHLAINTMKTKKDELMESRAEGKREDDSDLFEDEGFLDDDYVDDEDLYDYARMEGGDSEEGRRFRTGTPHEEDYSSDLMEEAPAEKPAPAPAPSAAEEQETPAVPEASAEEEPAAKETTVIEEDTME